MVQRKVRHDTAIGENREVLQGNRRRDGLGGQDREVPEQCGDVNGGDEDEAGLPGDVLADGGSDADADDGAEGQAADDDGHGAAAVGSPARAAATAEAVGVDRAAPRPAAVGAVRSRARLGAAMARLARMNRVRVQAMRGLRGQPAGGGGEEGAARP